MSTTPRRPSTSRGERTRAAVVSALEELIEAGNPTPSASEVAERAGISLRSVYTHFSSVEDLHMAVAERAAARVVMMLWPIDPDAPLRDRIAELVRQRARVNEEVGPLRRAAALHAVTSAALAEARASARRASAHQVRRIFATELGRLAGSAAERRAAAVDAMVSGETWDVLRTSGGLSAEEAETAVVEALAALLAARVAPSG